MSAPFPPLHGYVGTHDGQPTPLRIHSLEAFVVTRDLTETHLFTGREPCVVVPAALWAAMVARAEQEHG